MSLHQDILNTLQNDFKVLSENTITSILHNDLSHVDYSNNKGKLQAIGFSYNLVKAISDWLVENPDSDAFPRSFLTNNSDSTQQDVDAHEVHTITIDSSEGK